MAEFETGGHTYRTNKMNAREQLHLLRGLGPLFGPMVEVALISPGDAAAASRDLTFMLRFFDAFAKMSQEEVDTLVNKCLTVTQRREGSNGSNTWGPPLWSVSAGREQYSDLSVSDLMTICWQVIQDNLGGFFAIGSPPSITPRPSEGTTAAPMQLFGSASPTEKTS